MARTRRSNSLEREVGAFVHMVRAYARTEGRHHLPWRESYDPYLILVSEIMLQQTQVDRVIPYFEAWRMQYPTLHSLARSSLAGVLRAWSGLGYNRRAKMLRECAKEIVARHGGVVPRDSEALEELPGIGPYTAAAIRAFAFDEKDIVLETNIRAALIHHFFPKATKVDDKKLIPILAACLKKVPSAREWYSALMDYGAHIKKIHPNPSRRSAHHVRQSPFEGSLRKVRGALLRRLLKGPIPESSLHAIDVEESYQIEQALRHMAKEGLVTNKNGTWQIT